MEADNQTELSLNHVGKPRRGKRPDSDIRLLELALMLEAGEIAPAPYQRSATKVWNKNRKKEWLERCKRVSRGEQEDPLGTVCLYKIVGERSEYINDGFQRISTAKEALSHPRQYGYEPGDLKEILGDMYIHVQNRVYDTHVQAAYDFVAVNNGVSLNPRERNRWILTCHPRWLSTWEGEIEKWFRTLERILSPFSRYHEKRNALASRERSFLHLFCVARGTDVVQFGSGPELEQETSKWFTNSDPTDVDRCIKKIKELSAEIDKAWKVAPRLGDRPHGDRMHETLARWCLAVRMRNDHLSPIWWNEFYIKLFSSSGGKSKVWSNERAEFLGSKVSNLQAVCKILKIEVPEIISRRRKDPLQIGEGYQWDHVLPFVDAGDGEVQPLPARLNAAKAARK